MTLEQFISSLIVTTIIAVGMSLIPRKDEVPAKPKPKPTIEQLEQMEKNVELTPETSHVE